MSTRTPEFPACCEQCPHLDAFHGACSHNLRQAIVRELSIDDEVCPVYVGQ